MLLLLERLWREGHVEQTDCATHPGGVVIHLNTITLQGGAIPTGGTNPNEYFLLPAKNGESLSKTELNVPGSMLNSVSCKEDQELHRADCLGAEAGGGLLGSAR